MELARHAREGAPLYDVGFPFPRSWLYGIGGFIVVAAAFAIGVVIAGSGRIRTAEVEVPAVIADDTVDDVIVVRAPAENPRFPAFAPEGVIVVQAPTPQERVFAAAETVQERPTTERARSPRRAENAESSARLEVLRPMPPSATDARRANARLEEAGPETSADESARNEAPPVRDPEYAENEASEAEPDNRSWYGSAEYRREVAERRRAEREARRRRNEGW